MIVACCASLSWLAGMVTGADSAPDHVHPECTSAEGGPPRSTCGGPRLLSRCAWVGHTSPRCLPRPA